MQHKDLHLVISMTRRHKRTMTSIDMSWYSDSFSCLDLKIFDTIYTERVEQVRIVHINMEVVLFVTVAILPRIVNCKNSSQLTNKETECQHVPSNTTHSTTGCHTTTHATTGCLISSITLTELRRKWSSCLQSPCSCFPVWFVSKTRKLEMLSLHSNQD